MASPTLKNRIDKLINDLGGNPKPGPVDIRNRLAAFSTLAEALESGQSAVETEQKIAVMEATIKEMEAKLQSADAEGKKLQTALDAARDEIRRAQQQEQENEPLSTVERGILYFVDRSGQVFEYEVREDLGWKTQSQGMIDGLVKDGFLTVKEEPADFAPSYFLSKKAKVWLVRDRANPFDF